MTVYYTFCKFYLYKGILWTQTENHILFLFSLYNILFIPPFFSISIADLDLSLVAHRYNDVIYVYVCAKFNTNVYSLCVGIFCRCNIFCIILCWWRKTVKHVSLLMCLIFMKMFFLNYSKMCGGGGNPTVWKNVNNYK